MKISEIIEYQSQYLLYHVGTALIISAICVFAVILFYKLVKLFLSSLEQEELTRFYKVTKSAIILNVGIISFTIALDMLPFENEEIEATILKISKILIIAFVGFLLIKVSAFIKYLVYNQYEISGKDNLHQRKVRTQINFIHQISIIVISVICISLILISFQGVRQIGTSLLASAGVATVIIGFAAQRSIANLLAGFQIAFTQPIRIDDVLVVEGEWGKVEEINLTYVVMKIWDERRLVLPISYFIEKPFQNWTKTSANLLGTVFLHLDYRFPIEELRTELLRILEKDDLKGYWDGKAQVVQVTDTTEYNIEVRILVSARNSPDAFELRCLVREKLISFIQNHYPQYLSRQRIDMIKKVE
jgi:small-conductance mechanosensitive channel